MARKKLDQSEKKALIAALEERFQKNMQRHKDITWDEVKARLEDDESKISILLRMENTGGEPDVIGYDAGTRHVIYCDCAKESPEGRRSLCYDRAALESRKQAKPMNSVIEAAQEIGIEVLDEEHYKALQKLGEFDLKTQSWLKTPEEIRKLGGAIFADRRYGRVFIYHNGADSYYSSRGFRGLVGYEIAIAPLSLMRGEGPALAPAWMKRAKRSGSMADKGEGDGQGNRDLEYDA